MKSKIQRYLPPNTGLAWLIVWGLVYVTILIAGLIWPTSPIVAIIKLLGIFSCFLFAASHFRTDHLLIIALFFTFCADCILATDNIAPAGILVFCMAQLAHFIRLSRNTKFIKIYFYLALVILATSIFTPPDISILIYGGVYALTIAGNLLLCIRWHSLAHSFASSAALIGFILFICCDLHVAASYACTIGLLPVAIQGFANYMAWVFYFPAQVCIGFSSQTVVK